MTIKEKAESEKLKIHFARNPERNEITQKFITLFRTGSVKKIFFKFVPKAKLSES